MTLDPLILSRIQFGFTISWHIIFPAFTIGLAAWLATMEGMWLTTGNPVYGACSTSGSRSSPCPSAWGCLRGSSWRSSSAPTGACWPRRSARSRGRCSATRPSPRFCSRRPLLASCWSRDRVSAARSSNRRPGFDHADPQTEALPPNHKFH